MVKNISIFPLFCLLAQGTISCAKNTQDPAPQYDQAGNQGSGHAQEQENPTPWESAGSPRIPESLVVEARIRSLVFEDGFRMDYDGDTAGDGNGPGNTDDEEICRQKESEGEFFGVCMELSANRNITCKIDDSPQTDCDEVYSQLGDGGDVECEGGTLNADPALKCSDGWAVVANGEKDKSKTICRVLLSENSGHCLNAYKEQDDGTGTLIPVETEDLILEMQPVSWSGYDSGHAANSSQSFDDDPPLSPLPLSDIPEGGRINYKTNNPSICTVDNDQDETNGTKGTLSLVTGVAPAICTVVLTIETEQYADRIFSFEIELVVENDSTWTGYATSLSATSYNGIFYAQETISPDTIGGTLSAPELSYSAEDESICTVDEASGEATGVAPGTCIVNLIVSQSGYLDKKLPAVINVAPLRQYQGLNWTGFPDDGDVAVGDTTAALPAPTPIPPGIGIDDHSVEWKSGDCAWTAGTSRTIELFGTLPCVITVTVQKRGYEDFAKDFTVVPTPGIQSGLSWSPTQNNGVVGVDLLMDTFSATLSNNETLNYVVSDGGDTECSFKGLGGDDVRTLVFNKDGTCIVKAVVSRSGYEDWNSPEVSIAVGKGSITVGDWGSHEGVLNGFTANPPEISDVVPVDASKRYSSNTPDECSVDPTSGVVSSIRIGTDNCIMALTLSRDGYNDETHTYTFSVWSGVVELIWNGYSSHTINIANRLTPPTPVPPVSGTPGVSFAYSTTDTACSVNSATGALTILTAGSCTVTLTASANNHRPIKKNVIVTVTQAAQAPLSPGDASDVYGNTPSLSVGTTLNVDSVGATLPSGGVGPLAYRSTDENVCTTDVAGTVTGTGVGNCIISLFFAGDTDTEASNPLEVLNIEVERGVQTFTPWPNPYGSSPQLKADGNHLTIKNPPPENHGHGDLEYSSTDTSVCEVNSTSGEIDPITGGNCVIQARYTGDENYHPSDFSELITIAVIKFTQPPLVAPSQPYGSSPTLTVGVGNLSIDNPPEATGYTPVEYRPQNGDDTTCEVDGTTGEVTPRTAGDCVVEARFSESNKYHPSNYVVIATIDVLEGSLDGLFTWTPAVSGEVGVPLVLDGIDGNEETDTVTYAVASGACSFGSGSDTEERTLAFTAVGTCTVRATVERVGYTDWSSSDHDITVEQGSQTLTPPSEPYGTIPTLTVGGPDLDITTAPESGEGGTRYRSITTAQCSVDENTGTISPVAAGECVIEAQYEGNSNYLPSGYVEILRVIVGS